MTNGTFGRGHQATCFELDFADVKNSQIGDQYGVEDGKTPAQRCSRKLSTSHNAPTLFDEVILAAADEPSDTFGMPDGARLSDLWELTKHITVYSNREDILIFASHIVNKDWRLGHDGPPNRADIRFFPPAEYAFVDCTANEDFSFVSGGTGPQPPILPTVSNGARVF